LFPLAASGQPYARLCSLGEYRPNLNTYLSKTHTPLWTSTDVAGPSLTPPAGSKTQTEAAWYRTARCRAASAIVTPAPARRAAFFSYISSAAPSPIRVCSFANRWVLAPADLLGSRRNTSAVCRPESSLAACLIASWTARAGSALHPLYSASHSTVVLLSLSSSSRALPTGSTSNYMNPVSG
jgi:hypothetical protein